MTKVAGRHTMKAGFYNNHSFKAQNVGAGGIANLSFQGYVDFGNDTNNALDTGFGYANAATRRVHAVPAGLEVRRRQHALQQHRGLHPGQLEGEQPADAGLRRALHAPAAAVRPVPADVELLPRPVDGVGAAPVLYVPGCSNGAVACSGNTLNAMDPRTGQILTAAGRGQHARRPSARRSPASGNPLNGIKQAGDGIAEVPATRGRTSSSDRASAWPTTSRGNQSLVLPRRRRHLLRPSGRQHRVLDPRQPADRDLAPTFATATLQNARAPEAQLRQPVPAMVTFQYDAKVPASAQWQAGIQKALPWASVVDVSYVGNHGYNRLGGFQGGNTVNLNAVDFGAGVPAAEPGPDARAPPARSRRERAHRRTCCGPTAGSSNISQNTTEFHDTYHSIQCELQPPVPERVLVRRRTTC